MYRAQDFQGRTEEIWKSEFTKGVEEMSCSLLHVVRQRESYSMIFLGKVR